MKQLIYRLTEPAETIPEERKIFSNHDLKGLILPLFLEQLLEVLVGVADTFMVSYAGEAAVSGVSLVNMFNTVFIFLFSALASGGAVVVSQYIGSRNRKNGNLSAGQLVMISAVFSAAAMILSLIFNRQLLRLLFGEVDQDVMTACVTYLRISAYSYPAIAVYNAGAAVCRSMGKTNVTMNISLVANGINIAGNAIGVFVFHAGVAGVAYPSLIARSFSAVVILIICFRQQEQVRLQQYHRSLRDGADRGQRRGAELLVCGGADGDCTWACICHSDRAVHGSGRHRSRGLLYEKTAPDHSTCIHSLERTDPADHTPCAQRIRALGRGGTSGRDPRCYTQHF